MEAETISPDKKKKIGLIAGGVTVVIIVVIIVVVLLVTNSNGETTSQKNPVSGNITKIIVQDSKSAQLQTIPGGDTIYLAYEISNNKKIKVRWEYLVGSTATTIEHETTQNPIVWKIPSNLFGIVKFKVSAVENLKKFVISQPFEVVPLITWSGLKSVQEAGYTLAGSDLKLNYKSASSSLLLSLGRATLQLADALKVTRTTPPDFSIDVDRTNITLNTSQQTLTWSIPSDFESGIYRLQVTTTKLVSLGYPRELSFEFPNSFSIFTPTTQPDSDGTLGTMTIKDDNGFSGSFPFGEKVTVTIPGTDYDLYYFTGDTWAVIQKVVTESVTWTLPSKISSTLPVTVRAVQVGTAPDTTTKTLYTQLSIRLGVHLELLDDSPHFQNNTITFQAGERVKGGKHRVLIYGWDSLKDLDDIDNWEVGWYNDPGAVDLGDRFVHLVVDHVAVATGFPYPAHSALCEISYSDHGQAAKTEDEKELLPFLVYYDDQNTEKSGFVVSQAKYHLVKKS